MTGGRLEQH